MLFHEFKQMHSMLLGYLGYGNFQAPACYEKYQMFGKFNINEPKQVVSHACVWLVSNFH